jgi:hypothetical protein
MVYSSQSHRHRSSLTLSLNVAATYYTIEMQDVFVLLEWSKGMQQQRANLTISAKALLYHLDTLHFHSHIANLKTSSRKEIIHEQLFRSYMSLGIFAMVPRMDLGIFALCVQESNI